MSDIILQQLAPKGYLRAAINLSNFLLVTGTDDKGNPEGISPELAKALANELNLELKLIPFKRPGELADAVTEDVWDIGNIANESERAKSITFSYPYTLIESTFLVRESSKINSNGRFGRAVPLNTIISPAGTINFVGVITITLSDSKIQLTCFSSFPSEIVPVYFLW